jgi:hypothetical protein
MAAVGREDQDAVVARLDRLDSWPYAFDDRRTLVAEHRRKRDRPIALHEVEVGVADAGGGDAHKGLALMGFL